jgi:catechol 2,3-dioxygenase-like lactoylglutathione lyase family enzyme
MIGHGTILGGVVTTPDIDAALVDYAGMLALDLVSDVPLGVAVAASWGVPDLATARCATLRPASGEPCWIRLVEQSLGPAFAPVRSFGWAAYELTVKDVFGWPARLAGSGFTIVGSPREIPGLPYFVAMQVTGRGREMLYLNEVRCDTPTSDLPPAKSDADRIFITILATPDFDATLAWYRDALRLDEGGRYEIVYSMINQAFGLPDDTTHRLAMVQKGRMPIVEVDAYPAAATHRAVAPGQLPPGNALVSLAVDDLDALALDWIAPPCAHPAPVYGGARAATVRGPARELVELVERSGK